MKRIKRILIFKARGAAGTAVTAAFFVSVLAGCTPGGVTPEEPLPGDGMTEPAMPEPPDRGVLPGEDDDPSPSPAVRALIQKGLQNQHEGRSRSAATTFERALRLSPELPVLYYYLAAVRLEQNREEQAEQLALKGLSLTESDELRFRFWVIIANSRQRRGDLDGAEDARDSAGTYR